MVSHAVWKTWPSGLSNDKNRGRRPRFLSTESLGPCFSHGMGDHDQMIWRRGIELEFEYSSLLSEGLTTIHITRWINMPGGWFNLTMPSYQYKKSHCGDKTILRPSYLHNGISYTGKMTSLYRIRAQDAYTYCQCYSAADTALPFDQSEQRGPWTGQGSPKPLLRHTWDSTKIYYYVSNHNHWVLKSDISMYLKLVQSQQEIVELRTTESASRNCWYLNLHSANQVIGQQYDRIISALPLLVTSKIFRN